MRQLHADAEGSRPQPRRIALITRRVPPAQGGIESVLVALTAALAARGYPIQVVGRRSDTKPATRIEIVKRAPTFTPDRWTSCTMTPYRFSAIERLQALPMAMFLVPGLRRTYEGPIGDRAFRRRARLTARALDRALAPFDALIVFGGGDLAAAGVLVANQRDRPSIVTPSAHPGAWDADPLSGEAYRSASAVVGQSPPDVDVYRRLGVEEARLQEIPGASPRLLSGDASRVRSRLENTGPLLLFLGRREDYKGFGLLLAAAPRIIQARPDVTIAFVGPGTALPQMAGLGHTVVDAGVVDEQEKADWLAAADVLCLPSQAESFGLAVTEAWQAECAVATSDIPTLRHLVEVARGGISAPLEPDAYASALLTFLSDPADVRDSGLRGKAWYEQNATPEIMAGAYARLVAAVS